MIRGITVALLCAACGPDLGASQWEQRPDTPGTTELPPVFGADDVVEVHDSAGGRFRVHFTRAGEHAVPLDDADGDGTPDYPQLVGEEYERVLTFFTDELGFAPPLDDADVPDNGGDARFDVYLLNFPAGADGAFRRDECLPEEPRRCPGHMVQDNDFTGRGYPSLEAATRILASHELFHAVQAGYAIEPGVVVSEGTAVWASESYDSSLDDFERLIGGYLSRTERSLGQEPIGPVDPFSYGTAIFFRFLEERFDRAVIRALWETPPDAPDGTLSWLAALDAPLAAHGSSFGEAFAEFAVWNLYTGRRADPEQAYAEGASYPPVGEREAPLPYADDLVRMFPASARYFAVPVEGRDELEVALVGEDGAELDALEIAVAVERGTSLDVTRGAAPSLRAATAEAAMAHVALINTAAAGGSSRVGLCLGAPAEVSACLASMGTAPDAGTIPADAALPDAGLAGDAGPATSPAAGCSCRAAVPVRSAPFGGLAVLAVSVLVARRRR